MKYNNYFTEQTKNIFRNKRKVSSIPIAAATTTTRTRTTENGIYIQFSGWMEEISFDKKTK